MPLWISARLRGGSYDAAALRPSEPEWPPHPARLFCALVASVNDDAEWAALRWLERADPPQVWASPNAIPMTRTGHVVTNATEPKGSSQTWPARIHKPRVRVSAVPDDMTFAVGWPHTTPDRDTLDTLARLARRVPYLGRSTSPVILTVATRTLSQAGWTCYAPTRLGERADTELRTPYPGYTDRLREAYAAGDQRAWETARAIPYATPATPPPPSPTPLYGELLIFRVERGVARVAGEWLPRLTSTLRQAVISRIGVDVPAQVSGHGAEGRPHVGYLALLDVGHPHADGHVLAVALALPHDLDPVAIRRLWSAVIRDPLRRLTPWRGHELPVAYEPAPTTFGLRPTRWTAAPHGARTWVTATPLMLDRFLRRGRDVHDELRRTFVRAGYPEPDHIEWSVAPLIDGAVAWPRLDALSANRPRRRLLHAAVNFPEPVIGPLLVGSLRYLGLGLLVPHPRESR